MKMFQKPNVEKVFSSQKEAEDYISFFIGSDCNGQLIESPNGQALWSHDERYPDIKYFESEDRNQITNGTLMCKEKEFVVQVWYTYKHPMITAAVLNDLEDFLKNFIDNEVMINLAFRLSLENNSELIYGWIIKNRRITNDPIYRAIIYDNVDAFGLLIANNYHKGNWLVQAVEYKATKIVDEFLYKRRLKFNYTDYINTNYFHSRVIESDFPDLNRLIEFFEVHYGYKS